MPLSAAAEAPPAKLAAAAGPLGRRLKSGGGVAPLLQAVMMRGLPWRHDAVEEAEAAAWGDDCSGWRIAQVHRATLEDGREVVVKVQHDGIKEIILEDLKNAKSLIEWIAWTEPQYDFNPMIDEWCKEAPKELDFNHEAENTRTVSNNLSWKTKGGSGSVPNDVDVLVPEIIQILILEYMDGIRLHDNDSLEEYGVDKKKLVEEITRAYAHQIYIDGFFNGDPHPGNFLVSKEPPHKPILLDFGLTKRISQSMKQALAKMFLSCAEGDQVALLSAFAEMGLKLRVDMPQQSLEIASIFFRQSTIATEAKENIKALNEQRERNAKALQEKMKLNKKEVKHFNPVDAFPGDAIIFMRVLNLLRGLSASLNVRIVYLDIMRPFAESTLLGSMTRSPSTNNEWIYDSPVNSEVESKLRNLLIEMEATKFWVYNHIDTIFFSHVCAYKDGKVIIDTAAGTLGKYDPRPVQPDSLFPVFSVTKGITAGMVHWLVDQGSEQSAHKTKEERIRRCRHPSRLSALARAQLSRARLAPDRPRPRTYAFARARLAGGQAKPRSPRTHPGGSVLTSPSPTPRPCSHATAARLARACLRARLAALLAPGYARWRAPETRPLVGQSTVGPRRVQLLHGVEGLRRTSLIARSPATPCRVPCRPSATPYHPSALRVAVALAALPLHQLRRSCSSMRPADAPATAQVARRSSPSACTGSARPPAPCRGHARWRVRENERE
ncbi:hypothetical protein ZWY2020_029685 [Hordeum vulgare]|nr:hypothetical protein ZWY2020_029685 [Hordeum vulgare]